MMGAFMVLIYVVSVVGAAMFLIYLWRKIKDVNRKRDLVRLTEGYKDQTVLSGTSSTPTLRIGGGLSGTANYWDPNMDLSSSSIYPLLLNDPSQEDS